ncbi:MULTISPECIES: hypothetical protein [Shewanella]|nr:MULTISPECIES: hypothetical protein [Shewanella]
MKFQPRSVLEMHKFGQLFNGYFCSLFEKLTQWQAQCCHRGKYEE